MSMGAIQQPIHTTSSYEVSIDMAHEWCVDSGASKHMTNNDKILQDIIYYEEPKKVYLGDESFVLSHGEGNLRLRALNPNNTFLSLKGVLFVPKLMKNLLSVRTMTKLDAEVRFCGDTCSVMKHGKTVEIGKSVNGGLYKLYSPVVETLDSALFASTKTTLSVWHQRFGHLNMQDLNSISKNNNVVDGMKIDTMKDDNNLV